MDKEQETRLVNSVEALADAFGRTRAAQRKFAAFSQEQVDTIFRAAATAANRARIELAKMAVAETGMGVVEDKVIKNHYAAESIYHAYKDTKTCGLISEDKAAGVARYAEPVGVIAAVIPTTNPTSTAIFKALLALKTRNGMIFSPHPRAKGCTVAAAKLVLDAAVKAGAPEDIFAWIDAPSLELTNYVMRESDLILATGGPGMVRAAYSSGKPAIGVGAGNVPAVIDDSADIPLAVNSIIHSKVFDNGMICASEQAVIALDSVYEAVKAEFLARGCYFTSPEETARLRSVILINGALNGKIVGQTAPHIAKMAEIDVPAHTKILIGEVESVELSEEFAHEKLSPVLAMYRAADFDEACAKAERLIRDGGMGHTASIFLDAAGQAEKLSRYTARMETCRIVVNTPSSHGGIGDIYNQKLRPSLTLGCGSWGGNSVSENVGVMHLLNIKTVAERRDNMLWFRAPAKLYLNRGCLSAALDELGTVLHKKRAFVVTDSFLHRKGYIQPVTDKLTEMGMAFTVFSAVEPDPTLGSAKEGAKQMAAFEPDVVIAVGGGSPMDAAKIMWLLYEHPEADFADLAMRFMDIRKRVLGFPPLGEKAYFVAVPTTAGTGSEVTPFAVITDETTGIKYPLADYELLPNMAVVDANLMSQAPKGLTAASGIDAVSHAMEAYVSVCATETTDALAVGALKTLFAYLPRAYEKGAEDAEAREKCAEAATMAGMSFANAFLGICHSLAHKLGAFHHLPHGVANALMLPYVMRFNACEAPSRMATFPQYDRPKAPNRYAALAAALGFSGESEEEKLNALIAALEDLKEKLGLRATIRAYGVPEEDFLARLDEMSEHAFDDQCTGTNPRYPLIAELRQLYLNAYYGKGQGK